MINIKKNNLILIDYNKIDIFIYNNKVRKLSIYNNRLIYKVEKTFK